MARLELRCGLRARFRPSSAYRVPYSFRPMWLDLSSTPLQTYNYVTAHAAQLEFEEKPRGAVGKQYLFRGCKFMSFCEKVSYDVVFDPGRRVTIRNVRDRFGVDGDTAFVELIERPKIGISSVQF